MNNIPTPHISAKAGDFAETVLMPGDPKRAKFIAETYLNDAVLVNDVRGVQGYTGYYKGKRVSVMASGKIRDIVLGMGACTNSNYAAQYRLPGTFAPTASFNLLQKAVAEADKAGVRYMVGNLYSSDTFYDDALSLSDWQKMGVLAVEMESAALYCNAARAGKNALCICTISDCPFNPGQDCTAEERQNTFTKMMEIALNIA